MCSLCQTRTMRTCQLCLRYTIQREGGSVHADFRTRIPALFGPCPAGPPMPRQPRGSKPPNVCRRPPLPDGIIGQDLFEVSDNGIGKTDRDSGGHRQVNPSLFLTWKRDCSHPSSRSSIPFTTARMNRHSNGLFMAFVGGLLQEGMHWCPLEGSRCPEGNPASFPPVPFLPRSLRCSRWLWLYYPAYFSGTLRPAVFVKIIIP